MTVRPLAPQTVAPQLKALPAPARPATKESAEVDQAELSGGKPPAPTANAASLAQSAKELGVQLTGPASTVLAQLGVRTLELLDNPRAKAVAAEVYLNQISTLENEPAAAARAEAILATTTPQASGAGSAYLAGLRDLALAGQPSVPGVGFDLSNRDTNVDPRQDFYHHVNGGWLAKNPIPDDATRWGRFNELRDASTRIQKEILEEYAARTDAPAGSVEQKLGDFYASAMDTASIEAAGTAPIQGLLDRVASIETHEDVKATLTEFHRTGNGAFFGFGSGADYKNSTMNIAEAFQGGLGLPGKNYYEDQGEKAEGIRTAYVAYLGQQFVNLGDAPEIAADKANKVMALEQRLAAASLSKVELRDPEKIYNIMNREELNALTPNFNWDTYFQAQGQNELQTINMATPGFFRQLDKELSETPVEDLKAYMQMRLVDSSAGFLPAKFDQASFDFYGKVLSGARERKPRDQRMADATSNYLGMALGKAYVERTFPPEAKARAEEMIENIRGAVGEHIKGLDWMSAETKKQALAKLENVGVKVGYPDEWPDYAQVPVERGVYGNNIMALRAHAAAEDLAKIGQPVDKSEWHMSPAMVNAYYSPLNNEIVFPAAILQPPFFDAKADDPINYGGIGVVIGHEFTHGFDDKGSQFDAVGNLRNWWTDRDREQFETRADVIKQQANNYEVMPGLNLNGNLVLGEALADLGGGTLALTALQNSLKDKEFGPRVDGYTPEQRFFLGFGQIWASNQRPEATQQQVATDPHPVTEFRVNQTLKNIPAFAASFEVRPEDQMTMPEDQRAQLW